MAGRWDARCAGIPSRRSSRHLRAERRCGLCTRRCEPAHGAGQPDERRACRGHGCGHGGGGQAGASERPGAGRQVVRFGGTPLRRSPRAAWWTSPECDDRLGRRSHRSRGFAPGSGRMRRAGGRGRQQRLAGGDRRRARGRRRRALRISSRSGRNRHRRRPREILSPGCCEHRVLGGNRQGGRRAGGQHQPGQGRMVSARGPSPRCPRLDRHPRLRRDRPRQPRDRRRRRDAGRTARGDPGEDRDRRDRQRRPRGRGGGADTVHRLGGAGDPGGVDERPAAGREHGQRGHWLCGRHGRMGSLVLPASDPPYARLQFGLGPVAACRQPRTPSASGRLHGHGRGRACGAALPRHRGAGAGAPRQPWADDASGAGALQPDACQSEDRLPVSHDAAAEARRSPRRRPWHQRRPRRHRGDADATGFAEPGLRRRRGVRDGRQGGDAATRARCARPPAQAGRGGDDRGGRGERDGQLPASARGA